MSDVLWMRSSAALFNQAAFSSVRRHKQNPVGCVYGGRPNPWSLAYSFVQELGSVTASGVDPDEMPKSLQAQRPNILLLKW